MYRDVALNPKFAGVGFYFDMAILKEGERVLDLGSGSGMAVFVAARKIGKTGKAYGVDMTEEQLEKAEQLRKEYNFENVSFHKSYIENLPLMKPYISNFSRHKFYGSDDETKWF